MRITTISNNVCYDKKIIASCLCDLEFIRLCQNVNHAHVRSQAHSNYELRKIGAQKEKLFHFHKIVQSLFIWVKPFSLRVGRKKTYFGWKI